MKLAIFGGTGYVGQALVRMALDQGFELRLLVRDPSKFNAHGPGVEVLTGDALDIAAVKKTVVGCAAVLSTLGGTTERRASTTGPPTSWPQCAP